MSKRLALSGAIVIGAAGMFALGYYFAGKPPAPVAAPVAVQPAVADPPPPTPSLDTARKQGEADPVEKHNQIVGRTQRFATHVGEKMARVGDEVVSLHFKDSPPTKMQADSFAANNMRRGFFEPLAREAAGGDDYAAHQLWQSLQACREVPQTQSELREIMRKVEDGFAKTGGAQPEGNPITLEQARGAVQERYERCQGVTPAMYGEALEYLHQAADRGEQAALALDYAGAIAQEKPEESRQRYQSLWEQGHVSALGALGKDSLPHRIAWEAQQIALFDGLPEPNPVLTMFRAQLAALQNSTSPSEYNDAAQEAARLLRSNPNCCLNP